jgi:glutathione S-transferase
MSLATGFADKAVSLFVETLFRKAPSEVWMDRCRSQIAETLDVLEADRAGRKSAWWIGDTMGHVDVTVACALCHLREAHPGFFDGARWPALAAHAARCDALEDFQTIYQPFVVRLRS